MAVEDNGASPDEVPVGTATADEVVALLRQENETLRFELMLATIALAKVRASDQAESDEAQEEE